MGLYETVCRLCGESFPWFSGDPIQVCNACRNNKEPEAPKESQMNMNGVTFGLTFMSDDPAFCMAKMEEIFRKAGYEVTLYGTLDIKGQCAMRISKTKGTR